MINFDDLMRRGSGLQDTKLIRNAATISFRRHYLEPMRQTVVEDIGKARIREVLAWILLATALLAPLINGLNRPQLWLLWAIWVGLIGTVYSLLSLLLRWPEDPLPASVKQLAALGAVVILWTLIQLLPINFSRIGDLPDPLQPITFSVVPSASLLGSIRLVGYGIFFLMVVKVAGNHGRAFRLGWFLFLGIVAYALFGLSALSLGDFGLWGEKDTYAGVATGTFVNRNSYATFLAFGLVIGLAYVIVRQRDLEDRRAANPKPGLDPGYIEVLLLYFLVAGVAATLLATQSRLGIAAGASGSIALIIALRPKHKPKSRKRLLLRSLAAALVIVTVGMLTARGAIERSLFVAGDADVRLSLYGQVLGMILQRPIAGYGLDSFPAIYPLFQRLPVSPDYTWYSAHNTYLALWSELGLIIGSLPMIGAGLVFVGCVRMLRNRKANHVLPAGGIGVITVAAIHSLGDFSLEIPSNAIIYLFFLALVVSQMRHAEMPSLMPQTFEKETTQSRPIAAAHMLRLETPPAAVYAVGEVHGHLDLYRAMENRIISDGSKVKGAKLIVLLGDAIDKGPKSAGLLDYLVNSTLPEGFVRVVLRGNHEQAFLDFLNDPRADDAWLNGQSEATLRSYLQLPASSDPVTFSHLPADWNLPANIPQSHLNFLQNTPLALRMPGFFFSHAGANPRAGFSNQAPEDLISGDPSLIDDHEGQITVVHCHYPTLVPERTERRISLNSDIMTSAVLTCMRLEPHEEPKFFVESFRRGIPAFVEARDLRNQPKPKDADDDRAMTE